MKAVIVGGTGMLGRRVVDRLHEEGHEVVVSTRRAGRPKPLPAQVRTVQWDTQHIPDWDEHFDAIVNLGGKSLIDDYWTDRVKQEIWRSRVDVNQHLARWIHTRDDPPQVFVTASAVGYYGGHPAGPVDEEAPAGDDFLARLCKAWEEAALGTRHKTRVVATRFGIMLDPDEGALRKMLPPFRFYLGGRIGSGRQPFPWITSRDAARTVVCAIENEAWQGPVNVVAPEQVDNARFTKALGETLHRPTPWVVPPLALKLRYGEGAEMLAQGQVVLPKRLNQHRFDWEDPNLRPALSRLLREA